MYQRTMPAQVVDVLKGATKRWLDVLGDSIAELQPVLDQVTRSRYTPQDMFAFTRYSIADVKVVVLMTDPYPKHGWADGLALSTQGAACPPALAQVWKVLQSNGLIASPPDEHDLAYLAAQGVILLNCALTVETDRPGSHNRAWQPWMDQVIQRLSAALPAVMWCLWGDAQSKAQLINARHEVLRAPHPSSPQFAECDHFKKISARYPGLVWDPRRTETHFYTDGAAKGNQFTTSRAAWGVACTRGLMTDRRWSGLLETKIIIGPEPKKSKKNGIGNSGRRRADGRWDVEARPTNIRAEGDALARAMELALSLPPQFASVIHTDSNLWMKDMLGADGGSGYMIDWVERGSPWTSHANSDLCEKLWALWHRVLARGNIQLHFVNAWHDRERPADGTDNLAWWLGNQAAERAAESAL